MKIVDSKLKWWKIIDKKNGDHLCNGLHKKKVPDVGVKHRGSTDNKLGGGLITKYILISTVKIISNLLNPSVFLRKIKIFLHISKF
jgi:hypothetical protein